MASGISTDQATVLQGYDDDMIALSDQAIERLVRLHSGDATSSEFHEFDIWRAQSLAHERAARDAEGLLGALGETETALHANWRDMVDPQSASIARAIAKKPLVQARSRGFIRRRPIVSAFAGLAAMLMLMIAGLEVGDIWVRYHADYVTETGQYQSIELPDGSVAHMNTASAFSIDFSGDVRRISLVSGEVIFDVAKDADHPFIVAALDGEAMAVGTVYGVRIEDDHAEVTVQEGIVEVRNGAGPALRLSAGEQGAYQSGQAPEINADADIATYGSWQRGKLIFNSQPLGTVIAEAQRHTSERIVVARDGLRDMKVTGVFEIARLDDLLQSIEQTTGAHVIELPLLTVIY
ncbi:MAG: FecR domain-containing protein [Thalassospira sp.]|uniref:FecR family protein n=1 Tax=Thalassospira sp. TaxID=1912094 RepID=UPI001B021264|nr:FecR domain-containing protein [Thalassospira sp.]MBO6803705.1 FecR domain-containing protein [Thalassospira sp.]MBO6816949.1 FecR domain-containing protein [Thalassospira sp.]MBO6886933.1 FecR domain-containing protein [Thalassospira sp.]